MKQVKIFLLLIGFTIFTNNLFAQTENSENKATFISSLIKIDTYLTESSNIQYDNNCRIMFHEKAIDTYSDFEIAYEKIKPELSTEVKEQLIGVLNVYGQFAVKENFRYLSDGSAKTALAICSNSIKKITELMTD